MSLPRVGLEERGTPMLDARTARILAEENEKGYEARPSMKADSMRFSSSAVLTMPSGKR